MFQKNPQPQRGLFNPLPYDFTYNWMDDYDKWHTLTIKSREVSYFDEGQFNFMRKHLADEVLEARGGVKTNWEDDIKAIKEELEVKNDITGNN